MNLKELGDKLRAAGIRSVCAADNYGLFVTEADGATVKLLSVELFDTIPAPAPDALLEGEEPAPENKGPGTCVALGCLENNGWAFDTRFCAAHGRRAAGVKP